MLRLQKTPLRMVLLVSLLMQSDSSLEVIVSSFPQSGGTEALGPALETLGYRVFHMQKLIADTFALEHEQREEQMRMWSHMLRSNCSAESLATLKEWVIRNEITASVSWPIGLCWQELMQIFPGAKIVHVDSLSAEEWYTSASNTVFGAPMVFSNHPLTSFPIWKNPWRIPFILVYMVGKWRMSRVIGTMNPGRPAALVEELFTSIGAKPGPGFPDAQRAMLLDGFTRNNDRVHSMLPSSRILILQSSEGWGPLCDFLDKPKPTKPYPLKDSYFVFFKTVMAALLPVAAGVFCLGIFVLAIIFIVTMREMQFLATISRMLPAKVKVSHKRE